MLKEATVSYPQGVRQLLRMSDREFAAELRFLAAVKLFELGRLSSGKAAEPARMDRVAFLRSLAGVGVAAIDLRDEEIQLEVLAAEELWEGRRRRPAHGQPVPQPEVLSMVPRCGLSIRAR